MYSIFERFWGATKLLQTKAYYMEELLFNFLTYCGATNREVLLLATLWYVTVFNA
jgi:hypothetical protein